MSPVAAGYFAAVKTLLLLALFTIIQKETVRCFSLFSRYISLHNIVHFLLALESGSIAARMASSKTVFRPVWVLAEQSIYVISLSSFTIFSASARETCLVLQHIISEERSNGLWKQDLAIVSGRGYTVGNSNLPKSLMKILDNTFWGGRGARSYLHHPL